VTPIRTLYASGVDGATGAYLSGGLSPSAIFVHARAGLERPPAPVFAELRKKVDRQTKADDALRPDRNANALDQAGWGVIFARDVADDVYTALRPLLELRQRQAATSSKTAHYYREFRGDNAPASNESKQSFLIRHGLEVGMPADPDYMPYYLLLVGSPENLPFKFQYELDVEYAVGRLWFPTVDEYRHYAESVATAENEKAQVAPRATFFAPWSPGDEPTRLSSERLVPPLAQKLQNDRADWIVESIVGTTATRKCLGDLLTNLPPALLFAASHGLYFPPGHARHPNDLGALLCADWPGPDHGAIEPAWSFGADDLDAQVDLRGTMAVHFACFSAGTPRDTDFPHEDQLTDGPLAEHPTVAALPRALLNRGALAVIGHIDRTWATSFLTDRDQPQVQVFQGLLNQLMTGNRVGYAMEVMNLRYAALATQLTAQMTPLLNQKVQTDDELSRSAELWTGLNDARGYIVLGDPAVKIQPRFAKTP